MSLADLIVMAFTDADPKALEGSQVLFIGKAEDSERVKAAVEAAGGTLERAEAQGVDGFGVFRGTFAHAGTRSVSISVNVASL